MQIPDNKKLLLFDGVCNLCNSSVNYIIKHDKHEVFLFAPLQSKTGKKILQQHHIDTNKIDSVVLYHPKLNQVTFKSTAALQVAKHLGFPKNLMVIFLIIPAPIRNIIYNYIAKNRYKWFGKKEACMIPTPALKSKFLE